MSDKSAIEWTDATWNPIRARNRKTGKVGWYCTHVSEGCRICYAERFNERLGTGLAYKPGVLPKLEIFLDEQTLEVPLRWKRARKIFTLSMSDLFGEFVRDDWIAAVLDVVARTPRHTYQVLTKRPERMREAMRATFEVPPPNLWCGVSVEDQENADARVPVLCRTPAARRFLSCEPLLGPIELDGWLKVCKHWKAEDSLKQAPCHPPYPKHWYKPQALVAAGWQPPIDWVIVGGESGPGARPMHPDWARSLRDQCAAAGVPFFFKQWGEHFPAELRRGTGPEPWRTRADGTIAWALDEFHKPDLPQVRFDRVGKKKAGRLLDGVEHNGFPP